MNALKKYKERQYRDKAREIVNDNPEESEHLNALISPEKSQPDEHCVAYWMNMPEPPKGE